MSYIEPPEISLKVLFTINWTSKYFFVICKIC